MIEVVVYLKQEDEMLRLGVYSPIGTPDTLISILRVYLDGISLRQTPELLDSNNICA